MRPIESIRIGDLVWATDAATGWEDLQPVLNTFTRQAEATVIIGYDGGSVEATTEHPFWLAERGWGPAPQLQPGDSLSGREGVTYTVSALVTRSGQQAVYNLEIAESHSYHVAEGQLLVHNGYGIPLVRKIHNYDYHLDSGSRPTRVVAKLDLDGSHKRDKKPQRDAGGTFRLAEDEGGHLIGHQFHGPSDEINLRAQRGALNRGAGSEWSAMERQWKDALEVDPDSVIVDMKIIYPDATNPRPSRFEVDYWIDGQPFRKTFDN